MLIHHVENIRVSLCKLPTLDVIRRGIVERTHRTADHHLRVFLLDGLTNHQTTFLKVRRDEVFVADTYIFKVERSRMPSLSTHLSPFARGWVAISPFYHVEDFLAIGRHLFHRNTTLLTAISLGVGTRVLTRNTSCKYRQRLSTDVLTELEILVEAESARLMVVPDVLVRHTILPRAYGMVPVVDVSDAVAVTHTTARKPHELRLQVGNHLCQILP